MSDIIVTTPEFKELQRLQEAMWNDGTSREAILEKIKAEINNINTILRFTHFSGNRDLEDFLMNISDELSNLVGVETYSEVLADIFYNKWSE